MLKVAIVGSREYPQPLLVRAFVRRLGIRMMRDVQIISGGASGVDSWAVDEAKRAGLATDEFNADWETYGKGAGFVRNSFLVRHAQIIVAFWDLRSTGTANTIRKALDWGKRIRVFGPDGLAIPVDELSELLKQERK